MVHALEGPTTNLNGSLGRVEEGDHAREEQVDVVAKGAAELLQGRQQDASHGVTSTEEKKEGSEIMKLHIGAKRKLEKCKSEQKKE